MSGAAFDPTHTTLFEKVKWGERFGAFDSPLGQRVLRAVKFGIDDKVVRRLVDDIVRPHIKAQALGRLPPFRAACLETGELIRGQDIHGRKILLPTCYLTSGLLFCANTGAGKTNLLLWLLLQLAVLHHHFWVSEN